MDWRDRLLAPVGVLLGRGKVASAERTTQRYLQNVNSASCLVDLNKALGPLLDGVDQVDAVFANFATTDSSGRAFWHRSNFSRYVQARLAGDQAVTACVPLLWRIFSSSAYYPFSVPITAHNQVPDSEEPEIDLAAFRRAFALLVIRGFELFGAKQDGRPLSRNMETSYTDKVPRLTRIIFRCLSVPPPESAPQSGATQELLQLQDLQDTIAFTQPITYDSYPYGPSVGDEQFEAAASRLLRMEDERSRVRGSSRILPKADLQNLIRLLLLLCPEDRRWRNGLFMHEAYQRSGDIQYAHLVTAPEEASRASDFATTFVTSQFRGGENSVAWDVFKVWCTDCPPFIFLFFQLWASLFAPGPANPARVQGRSSLPISTANLLCPLNIVHFKSGAEAKYRFHENELQFQLDLQASTLVVDLAAKPELDETELHETMTAKDWFHLLLIRGEDLEARGPAVGKQSRLIAAFVSPPENQMWRKEGRRLVEYVWRSSGVQLQPDLAMANSGGMSAHVVSGVLELRAHGTTVEQSTSIKFNMQKRLVDVVGSRTWRENPNDSMSMVQRVVENLGQAAEDENARGMSEISSTLRMQLKDLKCYRLPGVSSRTVEWP